MSKALIIIDFEEEWRNQESEYYVGDLKDLISKTNKLISWARNNSIQIIFIKHIEKASTTYFAPDSKNVEIIPELDKREEDIVVEKNKISCFYKTDLDEIFSKRNINEVFVSGVLTNLCVRGFISDAYDRDLKITVIEDCCITYTEKLQKFTVDDIKLTRPEVEFLNFSELKLQALT